MSTSRPQTYDPAMPVDWITPHPDNPNEGDEKALEESIDELGFYGAILVRQIGEFEYQLLGGEHRWKDTKSRGKPTIPAIVLHDVSDDEALKILLGDNEVTRRGKYDHVRLTKVLRKLPDTKGTGFPEDILTQLAEHEALRARAEGRKQTAEDIVKEFGREYGIVLTCESEDAQEQLFNEVVKLGLVPVENLRVVSI